MTQGTWEGFRDADAAVAVAAEIGKLSRRPLRLMEVCGSHSHCIARYGLRELLPQTIALVPGPGCPVCVAPQTDVDYAAELAVSSGVILATFGDLIRVPGTSRSLASARAEGADVRVVVSPFDTLGIARANPASEVVFVAIGFETTAPGVAATILAAREEDLANVSFLIAHKTMPAALRALLEVGEAGVEGFILPGHVSAIIGSDAYSFLPTELGTPCAVAGFEPLDVLLAVRALVAQWEGGTATVETEYSRAVRPEGNRRARSILDRAFEPCDAEWRGLGIIPSSGLRLRDEFARFDARGRFPLDLPPSHPHPECRCGEILRGVTVPTACPAFGRLCTPDTPFGPCMVSSEGACAAEWLHRR